MTQADIIEKTLKDMHASTDTAAPKYDVELVAYLHERVPEGDSKTCEGFKHLNVECRETCHNLPETEMYVVDLTEGGKAWICCAVRSELFPETKVDESNPEQKLVEWVLAGHKLGDYCGFVPPDLFAKIMDAGLLEVSDGDAELEGEV